MSRERVRVAFIGAGRQANWRHYPSVASQPDVELAAVCDLVPEKAEETAKRWGVPKTYQKYEQMLEEVDPDAVYCIMGPGAIHEPVSYLLQKGPQRLHRKAAGADPEPDQGAGLLRAGEQLLDDGRLSAPLPAMTELKARVEARGPIHRVRGEPQVGARPEPARLDRRARSADFGRHPRCR